MNFETVDAESCEGNVRNRIALAAFVGREDVEFEKISGEVHWKFA
jgi:hypothetical protein